jgi:hypothetical protein
MKTSLFHPCAREFQQCISFNLYIKRRGRVVDDTASYSECPSSNLGPKTCYPHCGFSWFSSVPPGKCQDKTLN